MKHAPRPGRPATTGRAPWGALAGLWAKAPWLLWLLWLPWPVATARAAGPEPKKMAHAHRSKGGKDRSDRDNDRHGGKMPPPKLVLRSFDLAAGVARVEVAGSRRPPESRFFVFTDERQRRFVPALADCHAAREEPTDGALASQGSGPRAGTLRRARPGPDDDGGVKLALAGPGPARQADQDEPRLSDRLTGKKRGDDDEKGQPGRWQCALSIPPIYQRSAVVGLSVEIHGRVVSAPDDRIQAAWTEARGAAPLPSQASAANGTATTAAGPGQGRSLPPIAPWAPPRRTPDGGTTHIDDEVESDSAEE